MKVAVVNYGMGNLGSVRRALSELGAVVSVVDDPAELHAADRIVLPGVGSFAGAMESLTERGWTEAIRAQVLGEGKPILGICLGMQLLASRGYEHGVTAGLGLIEGEVVSLDTLGCTQRLPHVGWNEIVWHSGHALFDGIPVGTDFYFVHTFAFKPVDAQSVLALTDYGVPVVCAVGRANILGVQYHPEKSSRAGFRQLKLFLERSPC